MELSKEKKPKSRHSKDDIHVQIIAAIQDALLDPQVVGFNSVSCYRTGVLIPHRDAINPFDEVDSLLHNYCEVFGRLEHEILGPYFVHLTARMIATSP